MVVKLKSNAENMTVDPYDRKRATSRRANRRKPIKSKVNIYTHFKKGDMLSENRKIEGHNQRKEIRGIHHTPLIKVLTNSVNANKGISYEMKKNYRKQTLTENKICQVKLNDLSVNKIKRNSKLLNKLIDYACE